MDIPKVAFYKNNSAVPVYVIVTEDVGNGPVQVYAQSVPASHGLTWTAINPSAVITFEEQGVQDAEATAAQAAKSLSSLKNASAAHPGGESAPAPAPAHAAKTPQEQATLLKEMEVKGAGTSAGTSAGAGKAATSGT